MFPFSKSPGTSPSCHDFIEWHGEWLDNNISQFPQDSRMHLISSHRFIYNQVLQVVMHLTFTYCGKPSAFPVNSLKTEVGRDAAIED